MTKFWHLFSCKWTMWGAPQEASVVILGRSSTAVIQLRTCRVCGKTQTRMI